MGKKQNDQEGGKREQNQWDKTQEDSEASRTTRKWVSGRIPKNGDGNDDHGHKGNPQAYQEAIQGASEQEENVLHERQGQRERDQPPEQGDMRVGEPG